MINYRNVMIQFGVSRFMQAPVDLIALKAAGFARGMSPIVVQTTRDPSRARRVVAFSASEGLSGRIRGWCAGCALIVTQDIACYERVKLYILNLDHGWLALFWINGSRLADQFIRNVVAYAVTCRALERLCVEKSVAGFPARAIAGSARTYIAEMMARFAGPVLDHCLADIADHHLDDFRKRVGGFLSWIKYAVGLSLPGSEALLASTRGSAA